MNKQVTDTMKAVGAGMAVGGAAAALTNALITPSWKKSFKKYAKKAGSFLSDMMDNASTMMK
jgi:predicted aconitase